MGVLRQIKDRVVAKLFTRYPILLRLWAKHSTFESYGDIPWTLLKREVKESRVALITTGGAHLKSQPPFDMFDKNGDPGFREIPSGTPVTELTITHNYYDHSDADKDINIVFPIERLWSLKESGDIGEVNHRHLSFMGHILDRNIDILKNDTGPQAARMLKEDRVDIVILTPT